MNTDSDANWIWNPDTPASVPAGARISAGKSGRVARSLPSAAVVDVNFRRATRLASQLGCEPYADVAQVLTTLGLPPLASGRAELTASLLPTDAPEVTIRVGKPVKLKYRSLDADTTRIMESIVDLLPPEAREHRTPTQEELALTYPPGYSGDPEAEAERRPGTDT